MKKDDKLISQARRGRRQLIVLIILSACFPGIPCIFFILSLFVEYFSATLSEGDIIANVFASCLFLLFTLICLRLGKKMLDGSQQAREIWSAIGGVLGLLLIIVSIVHDANVVGAALGVICASLSLLGYLSNAIDAYLRWENGGKLESLINEIKS